MTPTTERLLWIGAGLLVLAKATAVPVPTTATTRPLSGTGYTALITAPAQVSSYQAMLAQAIQSGNDPALANLAYGPGDVDGNPSNPRWMAALAGFQAYAVQSVSPAKMFQATHPGFPWPIRQDGVLDFATAIIMENA